MPPLSYRDAEGRARGFAVEAIEEAGRRAGYRIVWGKSYSDQRARTEALLRGEFDMIAGSDTPERRRSFFVTEPWTTIDIVALTAADGPIRQEADLRGRTLAVQEGSVAVVREHYMGVQAAEGLRPLQAVQTLCAGQADAAVVSDMYVRDLLLLAPEACRGFHMRTIDLSVPSDLAFIANPRAAEAAIKLKKKIDELASEGVLASIARRYPPLSPARVSRLFESPRLRMERRMWQIGGAAFFVTALVLITSLWRARRLNARLERDLEARARAEAALRDSEARFRALFDSAPQTVLALDGKGSIAFVNQRAELMFGYPREALIGSSIEMLLPERLRGETAANRLDRLPDASGLHASGKEFPIEIELGAVNTGEGLTLAFIADISERAALQQQLLRAQKLESVGRLTGGVAHDFNNLLTVMRGYAQLALESLGANDGLREPLNEIAKAGDRAAALTRQLLLFSRRQAAEPRILSLNELLGNLEKMLQRLIGEDIELVFSLDPQVPNVSADPVHVEQVVMNLVMNARDAMPDGGRLIIETGRFQASVEYAESHADVRPGDYVALKVSDNGTGMPLEVQAHIFEPFFTTKEQGKGTGLGLSTVYGIVKQSGGAVFVYSEPGRGSTFKVFLPAVEAAAAQSAPRVETLPVLAGVETVLLAEDEPGVRKFAAEALRSQGYSVLEAANGNAALRLASTYEGPIHILVTDMIMPEMGGSDLAKRFAEMHPGCPVLLMSGYSDRLLQGGAAGSLIEKPFTPSTLLRRVREALDNRSPGGFISAPPAA